MYYFIVVKDNTLLWLDLSTFAFYNLLIVVIVVVVVVVVVVAVAVFFLFYTSHSYS